ncbi:MAG: hypothetical protein EOO77_32140 [Oxalobacteraceae bacterium]|nr:MAG: hypothetical protein EOO77_32140 [Oxalobacteraceae bacterium]
MLAVAPECKIAQVKRRLLRDNREALRSALEACDDAIIAGTDVDEAYFNRALLRYRYGDYNAALEDCFIAAAVRVSTKLYVLQAALCEELNHFSEAENFERLATQAGEEEYDAACAAIWPADPIVTAQNVGAGTLS